MHGTPMPRSDPGRRRVTLVGAGPGDPELLTLKAVRALLDADVILYDHLVSREVLELAPPATRRVLVGKRGGQPGCAQHDINTLMLELARKDLHVVRLKSGDPSIFGRAGEEIEWLRAAGVPVTLIAGVTSATAMAAAMGISLTHRDHAQSVRFVTGHARGGALPDDLDWRAIADARTTTVFYMAGRSAGRIAARLLGLGMHPSMPVAVGASVSRPGQRIWCGTLATLAAGVLSVGADGPVLIVIGQVAACSVPVRITVESRLDEAITDALAARGHANERIEPWTHAVAGVCAVRRDLASGVIEGAADPRRTSRALGF